MVDFWSWMAAVIVTPPEWRPDYVREEMRDFERELDKMVIADSIRSKFRVVRKDFIDKMNYERIMNLPTAQKKQTRLIAKVIVSMAWEHGFGAITAPALRSNISARLVNEVITDIADEVMERWFDNLAAYEDTHEVLLAVIRDIWRDRTRLEDEIEALKATGVPTVDVPRG